MQTKQKRSIHRRAAGEARRAGGRGGDGVEARVAQAVLCERHRISRELHDSVAQELSGAALLVRMLERRFRHRGLKDVSDVARIESCLSGALGHLRAMLQRTACLNVTQDELPGALRQLCTDTAWRYAVVCRCRSRVHRIPWRDEVASHLHGIARESVCNAVRHGRASRIEVNLSAGRTRGRLSIRDDGSGMPASGGGGAGMGLTIMRYRADAIAGRLCISPHDGGGTMVVCEFPVP
ncbi:MAG: hypothetical protein K8T26_00940 [Lentisphaerae bacterium]|nr:hypothetical protein [Lentisphaerota bacterium]